MPKPKKYTGFLACKKLSLSAEEKRAMVKTLRMLENGTIGDWNNSYDAPRKQMTMDMGTIFRKSDCGSVGCIAGWMNYYMGRRVRSATALYVQLDVRSPALYDLTNARCGTRSYMSDAQAKHTATAVRSFLTTGEADWADAMYA